MRMIPTALVLAAALGATACTVVERDRAPAPTIVTAPQPAPTVVAPMAPPPTVTVRPSY